MNKPTLGLPYAVLTGLIILAIISGVAFFKPQIQATQAARQQIEQQEIKLAERRAFLQSIDRKVQELSTMAAQEQELEVALPTDDSTEDILRLLHRHAAVSGVIINDVANRSASVQAAVEANRERNRVTEIPDHILPVSLSLNVKGSYQQLRQFIGELEKTIRISDLTQISIGFEGPGPDQLSGKFILQAYRLQD